MSVVTTQAPVLLIHSPEESQFVHQLAPMMNGRQVLPFSKNVDVITEIYSACAKRGITDIICTREDILKKLLPPGKTANAAKIDNYAGSIIPVDVERLHPDWKGEVLILNPLMQLFTKRHGKFMAERYISKVVNREKWRTISQFNWTLVDSHEKFVKAFEELGRAYLIGVDTETLPPQTIRCVGYTACFLDGTTKSYVIPVKTWDAVHWMRDINALPVMKVLQNGKYDAAYFYAYSAPMVRYIADTKNALHAWFAELPKDLGFVSAMLIRTSMYWKDLGNSGDELDFYKYCALDTWYTAEAFITWMQEAPEWAKKNYVMEMSVVPMSHMMEMRGIKRDMKKLEVISKKGLAELDVKLKDLQTMTGVPNFNPSSSKQVVAVLRILGNKQPDEGRDKLTSNEKQLQKDIIRHPLNERILGGILAYRGQRKLHGTYLTVGETAKEFKGRILTSLNPDGTDTGRLASRESPFWCGLNLQNIPREHTGKEVKATFMADEGYELFEVDKSQAEARGVAYCSGDPRLLEAVNGPHDFHSLNAAAFFGVPYEEIRQDAIEAYVDAVTGEFIEAIKAKTLNEELRDLSKRVNHGANYNMGPGVLLETMGETNVRKAQMLLRLQRSWSLFQVCEYLLQRYELAYPRVKGSYYTWIKQQVKLHGRFTGPTGWTRYCFGDPSSNKPDLNAYVAHVTQSLNAMDMNKGLIKVYNWIMKEDLHKDLQLFAQIHDSVFGQVRIGHRHLVKELVTLMTNPIDVTDCLGVTRTMVVPMDFKFYGTYWGGD